MWDQDEAAITVGDTLDTDLLPDPYKGPDGTVAVIVDDTFPKDVMMFVKDRVVVAIVDRTVDMDATPPAKGEYDAVFCAEGPEVTMGKAWSDESLAKAKKKFN